MKLRKTINGDYVNLENIDSLFTAPNRSDEGWSVFARIGNQTYELRKFINPSPVPDGFAYDSPEDQATYYMDELADELKLHSNKVNLASITVSEEDLNSAYKIAKGYISVQAETPKKRAPRKPKTGEEG